MESTGATSSYNALQLNLTKRFSKNLRMTIAYTWSKSLDDTNGLRLYRIIRMPTNNYGLSNFDRTNMLTISHVWQLPFGTGTNHLNSGALGHILGPWQIDGIFRYASGTPWTPTADTGLCACPGNTVRADVVPNGYSTVIGYYPTFFGFSRTPITFRTTRWLSPNPVLMAIWHAMSSAAPDLPITTCLSSAHSS